MGLTARGATVLGAAFALAVGCAKVGAPPGGPIDTSGPAVIGVDPDSSAVRVPVNSPIRIRFTESVDRASLERALWVTPGGASKPRIDTGGEEAGIRIANPFPESTTVAARAAIDRYHAALKDGGSIQRAVAEPGGASLEGTDPMYGSVVVRQSGRFIAGAVRVKDRAAAKHIIEQVLARAGRE